MNGWRPVHCERFDGESLAAYTRRAAEIAAIVDGFRNGRYAGDIAEAMERRLTELRDPLRAGGYEDAA